MIQADGVWRRLPTGGRAIGMFGFEAMPAAHVTLRDGDVLVLYTDGVVEAADPESIEFGESRIAKVLAESAWLPAQDMVDALVHTTRAHTGCEHFEDDFTVVVVKKVPLPPDSSCPQPRSIRTP
jgi:serine phosphatase RsbU (regulator of sigma subunit)